MDVVVSLDRTLGRIIPRNDPTEDAITAFCAQEDIWIGAVADGVGGRKHGEIASRAAVDEVSEALKSQPLLPLEQVFDRVSKRIQTLGEIYPSLATTLTLARVSHLAIEIAHVGDCRAYHLRDFGIMSLTEDQTEAQFLINKGILNRQSAKSHPRRNVLTSALSVDPDYDLYRNAKELRRGDRIVLMSDGAHSVVHKRELAEINSRAKSVSDLFAGIAGLLACRKVSDDASVLCVEV